MTVKELIEHLSQYPPDVTVIYRYCSDYEEMEASDIAFHRAKDEVMIRHNGSYMYCPKSWIEAGKQVEWATVVTFPGN